MGISIGKLVMQLILFSFFKFINVYGYIILYTFLGIYCLILQGIEDYSTFVNGYDMDSFNHLFDKSLFHFIFLKKNKNK
jgi:hypothetical protein